MDRSERILVGDLAKKFGISPRTVHWYEAQGLMPEPERTEAGYRHYSKEAVDQLAFVRKALSIGFSIRDIKLIIEARGPSHLPCDLVLQLLGRKMIEVEAQIKSLLELQAQLQHLHTEWSVKALSVHELEHAHQAQICPLIEES